MNGNFSGRYKLFSVLLLIVAFACIVIGNMVLKLGTTEHILLSLIICALSLTAYLIMRLKS